VTGVPAPLKEKASSTHSDLARNGHIRSCRCVRHGYVSGWPKVLVFTLPRLKVALGDIASLGNSADMAKLKLVLAFCAGRAGIRPPLTVNEDVPEAVGGPADLPRRRIQRQPARE